MALHTHGGSLFNRIRVRLSQMIHSGEGSRLFDHMPGTNFNYERDVVPMLNSAVAATVLWIARNFPEAPLVVWETDDDGNETVVQGHRVAELVRHPNPFYTGGLMMFSTLIELLVTGNAFWLKDRNEDGTIKHLWWVPQRFIEPKGNPGVSTEFLIGYEYNPGHTNPLLLLPEDVIHLKYGLDPDDPRRGLGQLASLIREIYTDDQAANFTASLIRNGGIPGTVISPANKGITMDAKARQEAESRWQQKFGGDKQGSVLFASTEVKVTQMGLDPDKLNLAMIRQIPEERVTAVLGIPAAVVGLGTGLETTKVGATLKEFREQAWENMLIPFGRLIAEQIEDQLLRDFEDTTRLAFDLRKVRILQDDQDALAKRVITLVDAGVVRVTQGQAMLGFKPDDFVNGYKRNTLVFEIVNEDTGDTRPPEQVEVEELVDTDEGEDEKDYPLYMRQAERIAAE